MNEFLQAGAAFVTLLLLPFFGVLSLLGRRALPWLTSVLAAWIVVGAWALRAGAITNVPRDRQLRAYFVGALVGAAFLVLAWLRTRRRYARWITVALACATLAAFARALWLFARTYA